LALRASRINATTSFRSIGNLLRSASSQPVQAQSKPGAYYL